MILQVNDWNNGYGCSCCRSDWSDTEWIHEDNMLSIDALLDEAKESYYERDFVRSGLRYEKDGKIIYGYEFSISKYNTDVFFITDDIRIPIEIKDHEIVSSKELTRMMRKMKLERIRDEKKDNI